MFLEAAEYIDTALSKALANIKKATGSGQVHGKETANSFVILFLIRKYLEFTSHSC